MFSTVLGQAGPKSYLYSLLEGGRFPNGLLFYGPRRVGKFTLAHEFVKAVLCKNPGTDKCRCPSCRKIDEGLHPDVTAIRPNDKGSIGIDEVRALAQRFQYKPNEGSRKIALVKNADAMTVEATNALLKTLEEPQGDATLVLTTHRMDRMLDTIRSRCQPVRFSFLTDGEVADLARKDDMGLDQVAIEMMGGMYLPDLAQDEIRLLKHIWDNSEPEFPEKIEPALLKLELTYLGAIYAYLLRSGKFEYRFVHVRRANSVKLGQLFATTEQAIAFVERGVKPFLVIQWYTNRMREMQQ